MQVSEMLSNNISDGFVAEQISGLEVQFTPVEVDERLAACLEEIDLTVTPEAREQIRKSPQRKPGGSGNCFSGSYT